MELFLRSLAIGFSIAAPVGPIGLLCIRRTLAAGRAVGLATGLGAATADALYGCVAAFGLTVVSSFLTDQDLLLRLVGGLFLLYLGARTLLSRPATAAARVGQPDGLLGAYATTLALTLTNPATILSFVAVFAGLGLVADGGAEAGLVVLGVFLGSALWWLILSAAAAALRTRLGPAHLLWVNRLSGLLIGGFGLVALASAVA